MGQIDDVSKAVTMDAKTAGNIVFLVGTTKDELGGSHLALVREWTGGDVPSVDSILAKETFLRIHEAIQNRWIRSCHDLSEGGLAVAAAHRRGDHRRVGGVSIALHTRIHNFLGRLQSSPPGRTGAIAKHRVQPPVWQ